MKDNLEEIAKAYAPPKKDNYQENGFYYPRGLVALSMLVGSIIVYKQNAPHVPFPWFFGNIEAYTSFDQYLFVGCSVVSLGMGFLLESAFLWKKDPNNL